MWDGGSALILLPLFLADPADGLDPLDCSRISDFIERCKPPTVEAVFRDKSPSFANGAQRDRQIASGARFYSNVHCDSHGSNDFVF